MEEKPVDNVVEPKKSKVGLYATIALCVVVIGFVIFVIAGAFRKLNPSPTLTDEQSSTKTIVVELFTYGMDTLYGQNNYMTNVDDYISDRCSPGIGCMGITNWNDFNYRFTDNLIKDLGDESKDYSIVIIDDSAYIKDGLGGIGLEKVNDVKILSETKEKIEAKVSASLIMYDKEMVTDSKGNSTNAKENKNVSITLAKENNSWKLDSFKID